MPTEETPGSTLAVDSRQTIGRFSTIAQQLSTAFLLGNESFRREQIVKEMLSIVLHVANAHVACFREIVFDDQAHLIGETVWAPGVPHVGEVPKVKHHDDCETRVTEVTAAARTAEQNRWVGERTNPDGSPYYTDAEIEHFLSLGSEACIPLMVGAEVPKAILLLAHSNPNHFNKRTLDRLREIRGLLDALFQLADFAQDRVEQSVLLSETARALPRMAQADSRQAFARALCALLTSPRGFGFNRAMVFWMNNAELPAACEMAVGGIGDEWPDQWKQMSDKIGFRLIDWIDDALQKPLPRLSGKQLDPLYVEACTRGGGLCFHGNESAKLTEYLETGIGTNGGPALRLNFQDPWIAATHHERNQMFFNRSNEFFVFRLTPVGAEGPEQPIGFVIADTAYRPQTHMPGLGFPDLATTAFTLNLLADLWQVREKGRSYFHLLGALPLLRHSGGRIVQDVDEYVEAVGQVSPTTPRIKRTHLALLDTAIQLARAKEIVETVRGRARDAKIHDLSAFLRDFGKRAEARHKACLRWRLGDSLPLTSVRIHQGDLESILYCLVDNAVKHGIDTTSTGAPATIVCDVSFSVRTVQLGHRDGQRILLEIANDGIRIPSELVPFLCCDEVSTSMEAGHGTGLSTARQVARAYGGDVVLISPDPVCFAVALEPAPHEEGR